MSDEPTNQKVVLRSLEKTDLSFVHSLDNNQNVMRYWFEEPYASQMELEELYDKHVHDPSERQFIIECAQEKIGMIDLRHIDFVHRSAEFSIVIAPDAQGNGYAKKSVYLATEYAFSMLNLHKLFLVVDEENVKAIHIYEQAGFKKEGRLIDEYFSNGGYRTVLRMCIFQEDFFAQTEEQIH